MRGITVRRALAALTAAGAAALAACESGPEAPRDPGVCWHVALPEGQEPRFNRVAREVPSLEHCAAALETMRQRFRRMGGGRDELTGAYQGRFLFLTRNGIYSGRTLEGQRYMAMVRAPDGRLVIPGAVRRAEDPAAAGGSPGT